MATASPALSVETTIRTGRARDMWNSYSSRLEEATNHHLKVTVEDGELCFWVIDPYGEKAQEFHHDGEPFYDFDELVSCTDDPVIEYEAQIAREEQQAEDERLTRLINADQL